MSLEIKIKEIKFKFNYLKQFNYKLYVFNLQIFKSKISLLVSYFMNKKRKYKKKIKKNFIKIK